MNVRGTAHCEALPDAAPDDSDRAAPRAADTSIEELLSTAATAPAALVISGEVGIGKSTVWMAGVDRARAQGFEVLSARPTTAEAALDFTSLADLISGVEPGLLSNLPMPQSRVLDQILLRDNYYDAQPDRRAAAAALSSVIQRLAQKSPVLLAVDDLQWLDPVSAYAFSFVTRRLSGRVGVLATVSAESTDVAPGLRLARAADVDRITLAPMTLGSLHALISERLGRSLPRPALVRIHDVSGGNPYYALELARAMDAADEPDCSSLPDTLADVVRTRIGRLEDDVQQALLVAASLEDATIDVVARAMNDDPADVLGLLEQAEDAGIVRIDGGRVRFAHPLLARGIYAGASPGRRRRLHRILADGISEPELRARHLALASTSSDPAVVQLLDSAAESARLRGAQASAADLLDLAVGLGGDTPMRRIRSATCHLAAGNVGQARTLLGQSIAGLQPGAARAGALDALARLHLCDDSFTAADELLRQGLAEPDTGAAARLAMSIAQAFSRLQLGDDGATVRGLDGAIDEASESGQADLLSQALGLRQMASMLRGDGVDEPGMRRAVRLEDPRADTPLPFRATMNHALLRAWSGQLDRASSQFAVLRGHCEDRGYEHERAYVGFHMAQLEIWRGDLRAAADIVADTTERAEQLGGDIPLAMTASLRASLDAYAGRVQGARQHGRIALDAAQRCGAATLTRSALATLAFLELSLGDHSAVLAPVTALLDADAATPRATEIATAAYLPDAAEALINLGRLDEAEVLVDRLERNGRRLDRPWMLAVGGRCRAILEAAHGDIAAATVTVERAMAEHDRLPMPFERARTQLVQGQLQRRQRHRDDARATLTAAMASFEALNSPLWVDRARTELTRASTGPRSRTELSPSERAVAELAAAGMTNRDVAASLFISPKTVEANLSRIYRKLGIRSRAELGRHMGRVVGAR